MTEQIEQISQALVTDQSSTNTLPALDQSITSSPVHYQSIASQVPMLAHLGTGTLPILDQSITNDEFEDEPDEILYDFLEPSPVEPPKAKPEPPIALPTVEPGTERSPKLRQTKTTTPPEKVAEVIRLKAEGVPLREIAQRLAIGKSTVSDILKRAREFS